MFKGRARSYLRVEHGAPERVRDQRKTPKLITNIDKLLTRKVLCDWVLAIKVNEGNSLWWKLKTFIS
jgi:hypothetical protein